MTTIKELKEKMELIEKNETEELLKRGTIVQKTMVNNIAICSNAKSDVEKHAINNLVRDLIKQENATYVISVNLAWMSVGKDADYTKPGFVMPSKNPNRKEVILFNGECVEGNISYAIEFTRKGRKITLSDKKINMCDGMKMESPTGMFNFGISKVN